MGFALGASAASLVARDQCCFSLTAAGGKSGVVGQLGDGQNRIGQTSGLSTGQATYCINNGGLTDENGRGCILTPPTTQFQCDVGASPTTGFAVSSSGDLTYNGNTQFYACATGDNGGYNIYTTTSSAQTGCVKITLNTGGKCAGSNGSGSSSAPASSKPASSAPASSKPASSAPASSAPAPSKPASSAPASSAPAPSKPASSAPPASQPASSAPPASKPASSAPPAPVTVTSYSTSYVTVTDCSKCTNGGNVPSGPASQPVGSKPASSGPAPSAPASQPAGSKPASSAPAPSAPASSAPAPKPASSAPAASGTSGGNGNGNGNACQTSLTGAYQTPHAIIPVNKNSPSTSYGTQYNAYLSSSNSTVFNFDIPSSYAGKQCSVIFLFPTKAQLETSDFTMSGSGGIKFDQLTSPAPLSVSYATCPAVKSNLGMVDNVTPGNSYVVSTGACQAGSTVSILASATGSLGLEWFEDWNPSPIGVFITSC